MRVSIVTYKTDLHELGLALDSLEGAPVDAIDIVDNGREKRIEEFCEARGVNYLPAQNRGYGAGHNISLRRSLAQGDKYHLVMNSDLIFKGKDLVPMIDYMEVNAQVGALHPRMLGIGGDEQHTVRMLPTPFDLIVRRFLPRWVLPKQRARYLLMDHDRNQPLEIAYMQGSFMLLRTEALKDVGLFDEQFFMYPEDIDLTRRIAQRWKAMYYPYAKVTHAHRASSYSNLKMLWVHCTNMVKYFNKWGWRRDDERKNINSKLDSMMARNSEKSKEN